MSEAAGQTVVIDVTDEKFERLSSHSTAIRAPLRAQTAIALDAEAGDISIDVDGGRGSLPPDNPSTERPRLLGGAFGLVSRGWSATR